MGVFKCCCSKDTGPPPEPQNRKGEVASNASSGRAVAPPNVESIPRYDEEFDSDRKAVQWIRSRSLTKNGAQAPQKVDSGETESFRVDNEQPHVTHFAPPSVLEVEPAKSARNVSPSQKSAATSQTASRSSFDMIVDDLRVGEEEIGSRSTWPMQADTPRSQNEGYLEETQQPQFAMFDDSMDASSDVFNEMMDGSYHEEPTMRPPVSAEFASNVDSVSKERYSTAVKLLRRTLIEKEEALTHEERDFLKDLIYSSIEEAPSADQLSAVESATQTLDGEPLLLDEKHPTSPSASLQLKSPPRLFGTNLQKSEPNEFLSFAMKNTSFEREKGPRVSSSFVVDKREADSTDFAAEMGMEVEFKGIGEPDLVPDDGILLHTTSQDSSVIRYDGWDGLEDDAQRESSFRILGITDEDGPRVLTPSLMEAFRGFLPFAVSEENFWMKFSLVRDGASLLTLLHRVRSSTRTIIGVETVDGEVFGSFTGTPWRNRDGWFGSGEAFLWRLKKSRLASPQEIARRPNNYDNEMEVYPFTGNDDMVQYCTGTTLAVGGGDWVEQDSPHRNEPRGIGFMLDGDLAGGETNSCATFANPRLCQHSRAGTEFEISNLEVWTLTPCLTLEEAQKLELHKLFVEEHRLKEPQQDKR